MDILEATLIVGILFEYFIAIGVRGKDLTNGWIIVDQFCIVAMISFFAFDAFIENFYASSVFKMRAWF